MTKAPCIFLPDENAQGCLVERTRRFRAHRPDLRPWEKNPCENCKTGTARAEAAGAPKEEETVDQGKVKENVLRVLGRKGGMTISNLKLFAAAKESKEDFRAAVDALAHEGKINTKQGAREGSLSVALPGSTDPRPAGAVKKVAPTNDATVPSKPPRLVNRASATPPPRLVPKRSAPCLRRVNLS